MPGSGGSGSRVGGGAPGGPIPSGGGGGSNTEHGTIYIYIYIYVDIAAVWFQWQALAVLSSAQDILGLGKQAFLQAGLLDNRGFLPGAKRPALKSYPKMRLHFAGTATWAVPLALAWEL